MSSHALPVSRYKGGPARQRYITPGAAADSKMRLLLLLSVVAVASATAGGRYSWSKDGSSWSDDSRRRLDGGAGVRSSGVDGDTDSDTPSSAATISSEGIGTLFDDDNEEDGFIPPEQPFIDEGVDVDDTEALSSFTVDEDDEGDLTIKEDLEDGEDDGVTGDVDGLLSVQRGSFSNDGAGIVLRGGRRHRKYKWFVSFLHSSTKHRKYNWWQAARECKKRGLVLVSIENYYKDSLVNYLIKRLLRYQPGKLAAVWTSGTKRYNNRFKWINGRPIGRGYYSNWYDNGLLGRSQPDNAFGDEDCVNVIGKPSWYRAKWHDLSCQLRTHFICEKRRH